MSGSCVRCRDGGGKGCEGKALYVSSRWQSWRKRQESSSSVGKSCSTYYVVDACARVLCASMMNGCTTARYNGAPSQQQRRSHFEQWDATMYGHSRKHSDSTEFKEMSKADAQAHLAQELEKLCRTASAAERETVEAEFRGFQRLFHKFVKDTGPAIVWDKIQPVPENAVIKYETLPAPTDEEAIRSMLNKLVVVKLNGGLGTSMGCKGPKSVIPVRNDLTFLDMTVQQIEYLNRTYNANMPLVLMNSFNTDDDTSKILRKYKGFKVKIYTFLQSRYPRINKETLMPIVTSMSTPSDEAFYPPGHGDFYASFCQSGLMDHFLTEGREYCFISNIDNLGATVDLSILNMLLSTSGNQAPDFVMEVTDKTRADVKGGTLIQYENKLRLLEIAQVPKENVDEFKSVKKFKIFNTNNLWMKLSSVGQLVETGGIDMEVIINNKTLDSGINIIQLETAAGAAMKDFQNAIGINVPRSRFLPVKKTSDLLLVMSNLYHMKFGTLVMSPKRAFPTVPLIKLGDNHFSKVRDFLNRFASIPDILELDHLTVSGDVTFGKGVSLRGTVIIIANHGDRIDIPASAVLENKIVSGNLRILDH